jgi:ABC-type Fe3+/spermidine/putrescine transport system ATPase subunit
MAAFLEVRQVSKTYSGNAVLRSITFTADAGEYVSMLGPSGAGKSTILRILAGFEAPDSGDVLLNGTSLLATEAHERGIGFVFQNFALFPHLSVFDNVAFGLANRRKAVADRREIARRVEAILALVGLAGLGGRQISEISGGQKQRVALARTLVTEPALLLLDEPLGALDANLRDRMMIELRHIHDQVGCTFIHVTGNEQEAIAMGGRVAMLVGGQIAQFDAPEAVFANPVSAAVARLLSCHNMLTGQAANGFFAAGAIRLPLPGSGPATGSVSYTIRVDRVAIGEPGGHDEAAVEGRFLAREYAGAKVVDFFEVGSDRPLEVQHHLSHHRPPEFRQGQSCWLKWRRDDARVFEADEGGAAQ